MEKYLGLSRRFEKSTRYLIGGTERREPYGSQNDRRTGRLAPFRYDSQLEKEDSNERCFLFERL